MAPPGARGSRLMSWCALPHGWNAWPPARLFVQEVAAAGPQSVLTPRSLRDFPMFVPQTCCRASGQAGTWEFPGCLLVLGGVGPSLAPLKWEAVSGVGLGPCVSKDRPWRPVVSGRLCSWKPEAGAHVIPPSSPRMSQK